MVGDLKISGERKIHLTMKVNFISFQEYKYKIHDWHRNR